jgi:hypothetical protein
VANKKTGEPNDPTNVEAVRRDLAKIAERDPDLAKGGLAALCLSLAKELDDPVNSLTSKSMAGRTLTDALAELRELAPDEKKEDGVDDLAARRAKRRKGSARATG